MVEVERPVQTRIVQIEGVRVLHGELPHPEQARLGSGLVPELPLDLVPELGEVPVGVEFPGYAGEDLLVGHAECQVGSLPVGEAEHLLAHRLPPAGGLPDRGGMHGGQQELLGPDGVHLLADDLAHLLVDAPAQWQHRVVPGLQLAHEAATHEQAVADGVGLGRGVAQGGDEQRRPAHRSGLLGGGLKCVDTLPIGAGSAGLRGDRCPSRPLRRDPGARGRLRA